MVQDCISHGMQSSGMGITQCEGDRHSLYPQTYIPHSTYITQQLLSLRLQTFPNRPCPLSTGSLSQPIFTVQSTPPIPLSILTPPVQTIPSQAIPQYRLTVHILSPSRDSSQYRYSTPLKHTHQMQEQSSKMQMPLALQCHKIEKKIRKSWPKDPGLYKRCGELAMGGQSQ